MAVSPTQQRRQVRLETLIDSAERRIAEDGVAGLKARELAAEIGVALGGLYNLVVDMDELALRVCSRTLNRLGEALTATAQHLPLDTRAEAVDRLVAIARAYLGFARANLKLWRTLFELRLTALPEWAASDQLRLFRHIAEPLAVLAPEMDDTARVLTARTLFAAVHGVIAIGLEDRLIAVPPAALGDQIEWLVRSTCRGMET